MRRRGAGRWRNGDSFGASLADILTTALGCVLLLFLIAVLSARIALNREQDAHTETQERLVAEASERELAESQREAVRGQKSAVEQALAAQSAARGDLERALKASDEARRGLEARLLAVQGQVAVAQEASDARQTAYDALYAKYETLHTAATQASEPQDDGGLPSVDLVLVIDATASMQSNLDAVRRDLKGLLLALGVASSHPRVGLVVFRDAREARNFRVEAVAPSTDLSSLGSFLDRIEASSTRVDTDLPEWMAGGMDAAARMPLRDDAIRLMVVVSDAADQVVDGAPDAMTIAQRFRSSGGRVYVVSTRTDALDRKPEHLAAFEEFVLPQHAAVASAGGGSHIQGAGSETLVQVVLDSVLEARDAQKAATPVESLKTTLDALGPPEALDFGGANPQAPPTTGRAPTIPRPETP